VALVDARYDPFTAGALRILKAEAGSLELPENVSTMFVPESAALVKLIPEGGGVVPGPTMRKYRVEGPSGNVARKWPGLDWLIDAPVIVVNGPVTLADPTTLNTDAVSFVPAVKSMLTFPPLTLIAVI
jgi:hypothetical protein